VPALQGHEPFVEGLGIGRAQVGGLAEAQAQQVPGHGRADARHDLESRESLGVSA
jgi:hypothetical protein